MNTKQWDRLARNAYEREMEIVRDLRDGGATWEEVLDSISLPASDALDAESSAELYGRTRAYLMCVREQRRTLA